MKYDLKIELLSFINDNFDFKYDYLNEDLGLIKPNLNKSVAGVLPSLLKYLDIDDLPESIKGTKFVENKDLEKKIEESFPSGFKNIIMLVCDGVGVNRLHDIGGALWDNITTQGTIASSMYPTMTSTVMTSLSFGKNPSDHGLVGYNIYNEHIDTIWNSLNLKYLENGTEKSIHDHPLDKFIDGLPIVDMLFNDVPTSFLSPIQLESPGLIDLISHQAPITKYEDPMDAALKLGQAVSRDIERQIVSLYVPYADHFGHHLGPLSVEYEQAIRGINHSLDLIVQNPKVKSGDTIVVVTADHGQIQVDHSISKWMTRNEIKEIANSGIQLSTSGRSIHAYCDNEKLDNARSLFEEFGNGRGMIIDKNTSINLAGGSRTYEKRYADLTLLLADEYLYDVPEVVQFGDEEKLLGQHGSLTAKELFVPVGIFGGNA